MVGTQTVFLEYTWLCFEHCEDFEYFIFSTKEFLDMQSSQLSTNSSTPGYDSPFSYRMTPLKGVCVWVGGLKKFWVNPSQTF